MGVYSSWPDLNRGKIPEINSIELSHVIGGYVTGFVPFLISCAVI